jgi:uncharacterized protein (DUF4415 family)
MISDNPDEDAESFDDEALVEAYLRPEHTRAEFGPGEPAPATALPDWPPSTAREIGVTIDPTTLAWFKAHHPDWRREIRFVLRAWVAAQSTPRTVTPQAGGDAPPPAAVN